jgi:hypothetical protein
MSTAIASQPTPGLPTGPTRRRSPVLRFLGVVVRPQSYRNIVYLLLGLPLGIIWFTVLVTALSTSLSLVVVALLGVPMLFGMWYVIRAFANVERRVADVLIDQHVPPAPIASGECGNLWMRLKAMSGDRARWRELGYLLLRFPVGVATFVVAVVALTVPATVAYAPIYARFVDDSFGDWFWSSELQRFASSSPWSWGLVPLGLVMLIGALHLINGLANACGRWTAAWLGITARRGVRA